MRYFNKKTMTEAVLGVHEINDDVIELNDDHWFFTSYIPSGKQLIIDKDDNLVLIDIINLLSDKDKIAIIKSKQKQLIKECDEKIAILQDIIDLDMQESNEEEQLKQLKKYRILLTRVDTSDINAVFPEQP